MAKKVSCKRCRVKILDSTARDTGGLCMPCKSGSRDFGAPLRWRVVGSLFAVLNMFLVVAPPYSFHYGNPLESTLSAVVVAFGFLCLVRGYLFFFTWWFWMFGAIVLFEQSGLKFSFTNNRLPFDILGRTVMIAGGVGAVMALLVGLQQLIIEILIKRAAKASQVDQ